MICLFDLIRFVPVHSYGHVGTLPPFCGTSTQHKELGYRDIQKYSSMYGWFDKSD